MTETEITIPFDDKLQVTRICENEADAKMRRCMSYVIFGVTTFSIIICVSIWLFSEGVYAEKSLTILSYLFSALFGFVFGKKM